MSVTRREIGKEVTDGTRTGTLAGILPKVDEYVSGIGWTSGPLAFVRPPGGGIEWTAHPKALNAV
ncbi:hypothetical protein TR51_25720 [Kitasatospora griseola]|uniref:Uncharacterized protein n=1 Tax=Kitasatospora griseola TaxID=2064 RepID=A0A0D0PUY3_KITGR|nr:hypothetical protein [Kitasatospora griseola]KIQ61485.1 hypothetical protein TR51_35545 [Kitasatospora griseola]KIQ62438.1 hypothetical protein TR51_25720 [Kitasatospora griseola]